MRRPAPSLHRPAVGALLLTGLLALAACAPASSPSPTPTETTASPTATPTATPTPTGPVLVPDGSATDNLPLFAQVVDAVAATDARAQGRAYIDALVAAGFPKEQMQVTNDLTTVGNPADSIQFSVKWAGECLVGQVGPSTPAPTALVLPLVPGDTCLIGQTRPIDW